MCIAWLKRLELFELFAADSHRMPWNWAAVNHSARRQQKNQLEPECPAVVFKAVFEKQRGLQLLLVHHAVKLIQTSKCVHVQIGFSNSEVYRKLCNLTFFGDPQMLVSPSDSSGQISQKMPAGRKKEPFTVMFCFNNCLHLTMFFPLSVTNGWWPLMAGHRLSRLHRSDVLLDASRKAQQFFQTTLEAVQWGHVLGQTSTSRTRFLSFFHFFDGCHTIATLKDPWIMMRK